MPDVNLDYSQKATLAAKSAVGSVTDLVKSGVNNLADAAKYSFGQATKTFDSLFKTSDFPKTPTSLVKDQKRPEEVVAKAREQYTPLQYPAAMKYFATFEFFEYERVHALDPPKDQSKHIIALPIPSNLQENFNVDYQTPALGPVVGAVTDSLNSRMRQNTAESSNPQGLMESIKSKTQAAMTNVATAAAASALFNMKPTGIAGEMVQAAGIVTGVAPNPYLAVMFSNIGLREHSFTYRFAPNSEQEMKTLKQIIRLLKKHMLPRMESNTMLFKYPSTCRIEFHGGENVPYTPKQCVMKAMTVNYTPLGVPAFFKTGDPVVVDLTMTFMEMSPFTSQDVEELNGKRKSTDSPRAPALSERDMGADDRGTRGGA